MIYIVSDVHGECDLVIKLLEKIKFSNSETVKRKISHKSYNQPLEKFVANQ